MNTSEKTYEMLWDCKFCGQKKNLGLTHRFCPGCGAPQDPAARYFPSDAEKIAVQDHPFFGADVACPACKAANSKNAKCCTQCGSPLDRAASVHTRQDQVGTAFAGESIADARRDFGAPGMPPQAMPVPPVPAKKDRSPLFIVLPLVLVVLGAVALATFLLLRTRAGSFSVTAKTWDRAIDVEQLAIDHGSAWCDSLPAGARTLGRHREQRSTHQVPDGETCVTRRKDVGNGTFKEIKECTPKTKSEPVLDDRCDYEANAWKVERTAKTQGAASDPPAWPKTNLTRGGCSTLGCEREGKRTESYTLTLSEPKTGESSSCTLDAAKWSAFSVGGRCEGKIGAVTGHIDCDSLVLR